MTDVFGPLSMCLGGLSFVLSTAPSSARVINAQRERSRHIEEIKIRLGACQANFSCWENHWGTSRLQGRHGISAQTIKDLEHLRRIIYTRIDKSKASEAQKKAWEKTKSRLRNNVFSRPPRFAGEIHDDTSWYDLWPEKDLDNCITELEKAIAAIGRCLDEDFDERTTEHFNTKLTRTSELREFEGFMSRLFSLGNELYKSCTTEPNTSGWALGLKPPHPHCDITRWRVPVPIDAELRFQVHRERHEHERFRMHISLLQHSEIETIEETLEQISDARNRSTDLSGHSHRFTRCHKLSERSEEGFSIGDLLNAGSAFLHDDAWLKDRADLGYAISQWSLLLWDTPWLERFCCHGIFFDPSAATEDCAHYFFESKIHDACRPGNEDLKVRNLGLAWAQLALGRPIRPAQNSDLDFEIWSDSEWRIVQREDINFEIITVTGSQPLQEAIDFCLRPESQARHQPLGPALLFRYIERVHEPIKAWYQAEAVNLKQRLATTESQFKWPNLTEQKDNLDSLMSEIQMDDVLPTSNLRGSYYTTPAPHSSALTSISQGHLTTSPRGLQTSEPNNWIWSDEHHDYYLRSVNADGESEYHWASKGWTRESTHQSRNSATAYDGNMAPAAPSSIRANIRFRGTPDRGWYDELDPSYRMRTKSEAHAFFKKGRVFAMLWTETAGNTMQAARNGTENTAITIGRFGQQLYSQVRRFVVMRVNRDRHFVYACAISSYGHRGTLKSGCYASEHAAVYLTGTSPVLLQGEYERGMTKDPIEIEPASPSEAMEPTSRIRFGKMYSIEWNVKVREIGLVSRKHMSRLVRYHQDEENNGFENDDDYSDIDVISK